MSDPLAVTSELHVPSLSLKEFRGFRSLELPDLGRVTLLAGKNGVGKTSVLDAFRFYASRGDVGVLIDLLNTREEFISALDEDGDVFLFPNFSSLFHHANDSSELLPIEIGSESSNHDLTVSLDESDTDADKDLHQFVFEDEKPKVLKVSVGQSHRTFRADPWFSMRSRRRPTSMRSLAYGQSSTTSGSWPSAIRNESLNPGLLRNADLAQLWDAVALTEGENLAIEALRLVVREGIERIALIGDNRGSNYGRRRAVAKLQSSATPVPLKRLGDGANRLLAMALALVNASGGILLIDEAENGIHYSVQTDLWRMVFSAAERANVQVIAATHSWDCVAGFATAASESDAEGTLFRLEQFHDEIEAVRYSEENLQIAARQRTEVR